jgi:hypothetical protein
VFIVQQKISVSNSVLKNKKSSYFLLPVTLGIWGFIGYKVYQYMNDGGGDLPLTENIKPISAEKLMSDSFAIFNNYRDPFLGNDGKEMGGIHKPNTNHSYSSGGTNNNTIPKRNPTNPVVTNTVAVTNVWPRITYFGVMTNATAKRELAIISIDGASRQIKVGDKINDLKIMAYTENDVTIQRGKEKKVFTK